MDPFAPDARLTYLRFLDLPHGFRGKFGHVVILVGGCILADEFAEAVAIKCLVLQQFRGHGLELGVMDGENLFGFGISAIEDLFYFGVDSFGGFLAAVSLQRSVLQWHVKWPLLLRKVGEADVLA